jgi:cyclophilin family peptidyl-prolyl cis-trans isomerase
MPMSRTPALSLALIAALFSFAIVGGAIVVSGCGKRAASGPAATAGETSAADQTMIAAAATPASTARPAAPLPKPIDPMVVLHTSQGDITLQLFHQKAPRTVENFLRGYAERGYYDQTIFHHAEPGVMLIAGGYTAELARKESRSPIYNESRNGLSNRRGTVAMIRDPASPHSATSEFFINLADNPDFDFKTGDEEELPGYCVFGEVVAGMEVVEQIAKMPTASQGEFSKIPSPSVSIAKVERLQ